MTEPGETVVADPPWVWALFPLAGAALMWLLTLAAGWVASLPAAPLQGVFGIVAGVPQPWATLGAIAVGGGAGLLFAPHARKDSLAVTVSDDRVTVTHGGSTTTVTRAQVDAVFLDGKQLVLLGPGGAELAREPSDQDGDELAEAFSAHAYPWRADGDPYRDEFRRWVPDLPGLPDGADPLFRARERALDKGDRDDAAELRGELATLGIVVRDEKTRQFWRRCDAGG